MPDFESLLNRWQKAGALDAETAARIRAWEEEQRKPSGLKGQGLVALMLGAMLLACGVVLFLTAHWDRIGSWGQYLLAIAMVALFHLGGAATRKGFRALSSALHAVGTVATGAAIVIVGQTFNIQEHWPAAVLLWAIAALAGWVLLRDQPQQILALLLFPAWLIAEFVFYSDGHIGQAVYVGRILFVWSVLFLTATVGSKHRLTQAVLFVAGAVGAVVGVVLMLESWRSRGDQSSLLLALQCWGWAFFAVLPLFFSIRRPLKSSIPVLVAILFAWALPWCYRSWQRPMTQYSPSLPAYVLAAAFAVFLTWWGARLASRALVNLGIVYFAGAVGWFYFSNLWNDVNRALSLIGLGALFLAGGWALEKTRRRLLERMGRKHAAAEVSK